ncbi:Calx-beta domain-containing protein [Nostoc sp. FACHB-190]|uniref:beta strand repeat-containing protein n=1 Tax=Nostoc sp. FACHB-190 TaxID=2692838 RepID=UPI001993041D|nr:Calx-beta domain-containing protein [Nostoc sp. FACHB-190]MBD2302710.1 tandem-95 repeat protein [Nostoc sp. FACHB-190]
MSKFYITESLSQDTLQQLKTENDQELITLDGQVIEIEKQDFIGTAGNDNITGTAGDDFIQGLGGNDNLSGEAGNDTLNGGAGNDFLFGGAGNDTLDGGDGDDNLGNRFGPRETIEVDTYIGGAGTDRLNFTSGDGGLSLSYTDNNGTGTFSTGATVQGVEQFDFQGGAGNDNINVSASSSADLRGGGGDDTLIGGAGNDQLFGEAGNDNLVGNAGNDFLYGGAGNDIVDGGDGNDNFGNRFGTRETIEVDTYIGGAGTDRLEFTSGNAGLSLSYTDNNGTGTFSTGATVQGVEQFDFQGGAGNDNINVSASSSADLRGGGGDDTLIGGAGNDQLFGEAGNDTLIGVNANSNNPGIGERDNLSGGTGSDRFILGDSANIYYDDRNISTNGSNDLATITDFNPNEDKVQLQGSASNYRLEVSGSNTNLFVDKAGSEPDELIAIFQNVTGLNLTSSAFEYVAPVNEVAFSSGTYSVNENGTAQVTLSRTGSTVGQISVILSLTNGTATAPADYNNAPISVTFNDGESSKIVTIPIVDDSSFEPNETINLSLTNPSTGVTLGEQNTAVLTIVDNDSPVPGTLAFSRSTYSVNEDGTPVIAVTVTRTGGSDLEVSATIALTNGTAIAPDDYNNQNIVVNFADGETSKLVTIPIINDGVFEANETINLTLTNPTNGATLGSQQTATLTIIDNDAIPGVLAFSQANYSINEDGTPIVAVTVTRTGGSDGVVGAIVSLSNGTATNPEDYNSSFIAVNLANGETSRTVNIPIVNDGVFEPDETINLTLINPTNGATIGAQNTATLTIIDNDAVPGVISFSDANYSVNENGTPITAVTLIRTGGNNGEVSITLIPSNGTATEPNDYDNTPITVNFANGETSKIVTIPIIDDTQFESEETITLSLTNPTGGVTIGEQSTAVVTIVDNEQIPVDNPPTVENAIADLSISEDANNTVIDLTNVFSDIDGDAIITSVFANNNTSLVTATIVNNQLILDYQENQSGTAEITIRGTANGQFIDDIFTVTVNPVNDAPTVENAIADLSVNEDADNTVIDLTNVFSDIDGDAIAKSVFTNSNTGLVAATIVNNQLILDYQENQSGTAEITIRGTANGQFIDDIFTVAVNPVDDPPTVENAIADLSVNEDADNTVIDLTNVFSDIDGDAIAKSVFTNSNTGLVAATIVNNQLILDYQENQSGTAEITIRGTANGQFIDDIFTVAVNPVDDPPTVENAIADLSVNEDADNTVIDLTNVFSDIDGDGIAKSVFTNNNTSLVTATIVNNQLILDYQENQSGTAEITIRGTANGQFIDDIFTVTVNPVNDAPTVENAISDQTVLEDEIFNFTFDANTFNDVDAGDSLSYTANLVNGNSLPTWLNFDAATRTFSGTPTNSDVGILSIKLTATDNAGASVEDVFDLEIINVNDAPIAADDTATTDQNTPLTLSIADLLANDSDIDGDSLSITGVNNGTNGSVVFNIEQGNIVFTPTLNFSGGASFNYTVSDGNGGTSTATVAVTVNPANQPNEIIGTPRRDVLIGTNNSDRIIGLQGADTLIGGGGNDEFVYTNIRDRGDTITDFEVGKDKIVFTQLLDSLVAGGYNGNNAITEGYVRVVQGSSNSSFNVQIDADGPTGNDIFRPFITVNVAGTGSLNNPNNFVF